MSNQKKNIEQVAATIVDVVLKVHKTLGPGLLESSYQQCLELELRKRGLKVETEVVLPIIYDGIRLDAGYRLDMRIEEMIVIENKVVEKILPVHEAQLLTYLKLSGLHLGFIINWNVALVKYGIKRMVNRLEPEG
jgi:GxxExxY protein